MIKVHIAPSYLHVEGHAGYAPAGQDIVCAAVSALTLTLADSLQALTEDNIQSTLVNGDAFIAFENPSEEAKLLIDSFFIGVSGIARSYPDHIEIQ